MPRPSFCACCRRHAKRTSGVQHVGHECGRNAAVFESGGGLTIAYMVHSCCIASLTERLRASKREEQGEHTTGPEWGRRVFGS